jgi:hypothetical protein
MQNKSHLDLAALVIGYSRHTGIANLLGRLTESGVTNIYIAIDGPRNIKDRLEQVKIKEVVEKHLKKLDIKVLQRDVNLGAAAGVISAIDWFFSHEKMGVILEDDLEISRDFCTYAKNALDKYVYDQDVWMISGTQHFPNFGNSKETTWTNYPMIWGWAGWSQKWNVMRTSLLKTKKIRVRNLLDSNYLFWAIGANRALTGKIDAWDIPLAFEFKSQKKLSLLPPVNLVSNIGNDKVATNTILNCEFMHQKLENLDGDYKFSDKSMANSALEYNTLLEKKVFKVRKRHIGLPYYSFLLDFIKFPKSDRKIPLNERLLIL